MNKILRCAVIDFFGTVIVCCRGRRPVQNVLTVFFIVNQIRCPEAAEVIITDFYKSLQFTRSSDSQTEKYLLPFLPISSQEL